MNELMKRMGIARAAAGDDHALRDCDRLGAEVYANLRTIAAVLMKSEMREHTLQATAVVHEAWIRLESSRAAGSWTDQVHFLRCATRAMRQVLIDYARSSAAQKRIPKGQQIPFDDLVAAYSQSSGGLPELHEALQELGRKFPMRERIVEFHFFGGMSFDEVARAVGMPLRTVEREWRQARTSLWRALR